MATDLRIQAAGVVPTLRDPGGRPVRVVSDHAAVTALLRDPRLSADRSLPGFPFVSPAEAAAPAPFVRREGQAHRSTRSQVVRQLRPRALVDTAAGRRGELRRLVERFVAGRHSGEVVAELAVPVATATVRAAIGIDEPDHAELDDLATALSRGVDEHDVAASSQARAETFSRLRTFLSSAVHRSSRGVVGAMLADEGPQAATADEVVDTAVILLVAGHETVVSTIAQSVLQLSRRDDLVRWAGEDPGGTRWPTLVEELLRRTSVVQSVVTRVATEDVVVGDSLLRAGEGVVLRVDCANHDPAVFPRPSRLDPHRPRLADHLGFGGGRHACAGQALAREVLVTVLPELLAHTPGLRVLDAAPAFAQDAAVASLRTLRVGWDAQPA